MEDFKMCKRAVKTLLILICWLSEGSLGRSKLYRIVDCHWKYEYSAKV